MKLLTTPEAAAVLSVGIRTMKELAKQRKIAVVKFGRNVRFDVADLERFAESNKVKAAGWKGA